MRQDAGGGRAVAVEVLLHRFAIICAVAPGAIAVFVEPLGGGRLKRGHHQAGVIPHRHDCGLAHAPPGWRPGLRGLDERGLEAATGRRRLAMGLGQRAPLVMEPPPLLEGGSGLAAPDGMAREAKDTIGPAARRAHRQHLWRGPRASATDDERRVRPVAAQRRQQPGQDPRMFCPAGTGARAQGGRDQDVRGPCANTERERAMVPRGMLIKGQLLRPIRGLSGVGHIEDHGSRRLGRAGAAMVHPGARQTIQVLAVHWGLKPGEGGGPGEVVRRIQGTSRAPACAHGVIAEVMGILRVRIPGGDLINTLGQKVP
jgi:hypothetical protein